MMPATSSDCDAPWFTWAPSGRRSITIRRASAGFAARSTVIPFASRAAVARFTLASSATVPNRRVMDGSSSGLSSLITFPPGVPGGKLASANTSPRPSLLHKQLLSKPDVAGLLDQVVADALPGRRGLGAWRALLRAHATLMRQLGTDLESKTGLHLGDFDVLGQLAEAGGALRMTELAERTLSSRSAMTRRIDRMADEGLVRRANADGDARGVVVALTDAGLRRLTETVPIHLRGVAELFVGRLDDQELADLERILDKVTLDCNFG